MTTGTQRSHAVLVLGMHRSGTSAVTRVINLLGAELGGDLLKPAEDNPLGFWEHRQIVGIHEQLLEAFGRDWHDVRELPENWLYSKMAEVARGKLVELLRSEFSNVPLWVVKDPRLCRLLPLWRLVLADLNIEAHALLVIRPPDEVAQSLRARDGIPAGLAELLWLQHLVEAELASRNMSRSAISFPGLLDNWSDCMRRVGDELQLTWPISPNHAQLHVEQFLDSNERHYKSANKLLRTRPALIKRAYDSFVAKADGTKNWSSAQRISDLYAEYAGTFLGSLKAMGDSLNASRLEVEQKGSEISELRRTLNGFASASEEYHALGHFRSHGNSHLSDHAKIYFRRADEIYSEERSASVLHNGLYERTELRFDIQEAGSSDFIRFDPSEFPGEFIVRNFRVNGHHLDDLPYAAESNCRQLVTLSEGELRIATAESDPNVEFDIRKLKDRSKHDLVVELTCQRSTLRGELLQLMEQSLVDGKVVVHKILGYQKEHKDIFALLKQLVESLSSQQQITSERLSVLEQGFAEFAKKGVEQHAAHDAQTVLLKQLVESLSSQQQRASESLSVLEQGFAKFAKKSVEQHAARDAQLAGLWQEHAKQSEDIRCHLSSLTLNLRKITSEQELLAISCTNADQQVIEKLAGLDQQLSTLIELQKRPFFERLMSRRTKRSV